MTSSTGTDTYSSIAAGIGSLKGPLHGGANIQVVDMFHHLKENIADWKNVDEIDTYFMRMLNKEAYNKTGLIYGIGHAVYTISDPRAVVLKELARDLAKEKGREEEFAFLELLESRAIECFAKHKGTKKRVSSNVDFYSGFVYEMIGLPQEIYTPLFAMASASSVRPTRTSSKSSRISLLQTANTGWACELRNSPDYDNDPDSPFSMRQSGFAVFPSCRPSGCPLFAGRFW